MPLRIANVLHTNKPGLGRSVVFFNKQMGALHAVYWLKPFLLVLNKYFPFFSVINGKKEEKGYKHIFFCFCFNAKKKFQPVNSVQSTSLLVKIYNIVAYVATVISGLRLTKVTAHYQILIVTL